MPVQHFGPFDQHEFVPRFVHPERQLGVFEMPQPIEEPAELPKRLRPIAHRGGVGEAQRIATAQPRLLLVVFCLHEPGQHLRLVGALNAYGADHTRRPQRPRERRGPATAPGGSRRP